MDLNASTVMSVTSAGPSTRAATPIHFWNAAPVVSVVLATSLAGTVTKVGAIVVPFLVTVTNESSGSPRNTVYFPEMSSTSPRSRVLSSSYWVQPFLGQKTWMPLSSPPPGSCTQKFTRVLLRTRATTVTFLTSTTSLGPGGF